jgi:hypothetical protein
MAKKSRVKLSKHRKAGPTDYLVFDNPDKRDAGDVSASELSWPWRHCIVGPPGSGKRVLLLNQILRMQERPARTVVIHLDKTTREYDKVADEIYTLDDGFDFTALGDGEQRTLLILDELPWANLKKDQRDSLVTLFRYGSTHKNCSIALLYQVFSKIPVEVRRMCSAFSFFPGCDRQELPHMSMAVGVDLLELKSLLCLTRSKQESITVDTAVPADHPLRYRLCFVWPIVRNVPAKAAVAEKARAPVPLAGGAMIVVPPPSDLPEPVSSQLIDGDVDAPGDPAVGDGPS